MSTHHVGGGTQQLAGRGEGGGLRCGEAWCVCGGGRGGMSGEKVGSGLKGWGCGLLGFRPQGLGMWSLRVQASVS